MVRVLGVVGAMVIGSIEGVVWVVVIIVGGVVVIVVQIEVVVVAVGGGRKGGLARVRHCKGGQHGEHGEGWWRWLGGGRTELVLGVKVVRWEVRELEVTRVQLHHDLKGPAW